METQERVFYTSENGDEWLLVNEGGAVAVRHRPNAPSGGKERTMELATFLMHERHSAQNLALHKLLATLTFVPPSESSADVLNAVRSQE